MSREEISHDYDWTCPECGQSGHNSEDDKIWKFCPYCGHEVQIQNLREIWEHHVLMAKRSPPEDGEEEARK